MSRFPVRSGLLARLLASLLVVGLVACQPAGTETGTRRADPASETASPPAGSAQGTLEDAPSRVLGSAELSLAYRAILERFVDPVDSRRLLQIARQTLQTSLRERQVLPMFSLPVDSLPDPSGQVDRDWAAFASAYDSVVEKLPAWASETHPDWLVLRKMVESLEDGHSEFLTPDEVRRRNETSYAGIGVRLARTDPPNPPLVAEVFPDSPAAAAGVRGGDRIVAVDGQQLAGRPLSEVVQLIRGPRGSQVTIQVRRLTAPRPLEFRITRAQVQPEQVVGGLLANLVGYVRLRSFSEETAEQTLAMLQAGQQRGARAWIVDLRGNPGGSLAAVRRVAGAFVEEGRAIGYEVDRQRQQAPITAEGPPLVRGVPVVVLVDRDTASGGEILAAALRDFTQAQIVGTTSSGSVGVATVLPLPDGSALQITGQRYLTASGAQIDRVGLAPDVEVALTDADLEASRDPQLTRAVEVLLVRSAGR